MVHGASRWKRDDHGIFILRWAVGLGIVWDHVGFSYGGYPHFGQFTEKQSMAISGADLLEVPTIIIIL